MYSQIKHAIMVKIMGRTRSRGQVAQLRVNLLMIRTDSLREMSKDLSGRVMFSIWVRGQEAALMCLLILSIVFLVVWCYCLTVPRGVLCYKALTWARDSCFYHRFCFLCLSMVVKYGRVIKNRFTFSIGFLCWCTTLLFFLLVGHFFSSHLKGMRIS